MLATNPEENALLTAILAEPEEDTPRLVYADWLDEHDHPMYARAIRAHVAHARNADPKRLKTTQKVMSAMRKIAKKSIKGHNGYRCDVSMRGGIIRFEFRETRNVFDVFLVYTFTRGICTQLKCTWRFWDNHWQKLQETPALPIRKVELTTRPNVYVYPTHMMTIAEMLKKKWPDVFFTFPGSGSGNA